MTLWDDSHLDGTQNVNKILPSIFIRGTEVKCNRKEGRYPTSTVFK